MPNIPELRAGDHLLYKPNSLVGYAIAIKTGFMVCHIEIYLGEGKSFASRDGIGVNIYPLRIADLTYVLRPVKKTYDRNVANKWAESVCGQGYDFKGLMCFYLAVKQGSPNKMFCSEAARRFDAQANIESFHPSWDADRTAPADFLKSPAFEHIYINA